MRILPRIVNVYSQIQSAHYVECRQSMQNGGGPACLRLRVPMTAAELAAVNPDYLLTQGKIDRLENWVNQYYRDRLSIADFLDPEFRRSCDEALEALEDVIGWQSQQSDDLIYQLLNSCVHVTNRLR